MGEQSYGVIEPLPTSRLRHLLTWSNFIALGVILYELTNQPALGAAGLCLKFGLEDFRNGVWLLKVDPLRPRARACCWLYVSWGLFKSMVIGFGMGVFIACVLGSLFANAGNAVGQLGMKSALDGVGWTMIAGCCLSGVTCVLAVVVARVHRLKLWLHESVGGARRRGVWPPYDAARCWTVTGSDLAPPVRQCFLATIPCAFIMSVPSVFPKHARWEILVVGLATLGLAVLWFMMVRLASADFPAQCWPPDELAPSPDLPLQ